MNQQLFRFKVSDVRRDPPNCLNAIVFIQAQFRLSLFRRGFFRILSENWNHYEPTMAVASFRVKRMKMGHRTADANLEFAALFNFLSLSCDVVQWNFSRVSRRILLLSEIYISYGLHANEKTDELKLVNSQIDVEIRNLSDTLYEELEKEENLIKKVDLCLRVTVLGVPESLRFLLNRCQELVDDEQTAWENYFILRASTLFRRKKLMDLRTEIEAFFHHVEAKRAYGYVDERLNSKRLILEFEIRFKWLRSTSLSFADLQISVAQMQRSFAFYSDELGLTNPYLAQLQQNIHELHDHYQTQIKKNRDEFSEKWNLLYARLKTDDFQRLSYLEKKTAKEEFLEIQAQFDESMDYYVYALEIDDPGLLNYVCSVQPRSRAKIFLQNQKLRIENEIDESKLCREDAVKRIREFFQETVEAMKQLNLGQKCDIDEEDAEFAFNPVYTSPTRDFAKVLKRRLQTVEETLEKLADANETFEEVEKMEIPKDKKKKWSSEQRIYFLDILRKDFDKRQRLKMHSDLFRFPDAKTEDERRAHIDTNPDGILNLPSVVFTYFGDFLWKPENGEVYPPVYVNEAPTNIPWTL